MIKCGNIMAVFIHYFYGASGKVWLTKYNHIISRRCAKVKEKQDVPSSHTLRYITHSVPFSVSNPGSHIAAPSLLQLMPWFRQMIDIFAEFSLISHYLLTEAKFAVLSFELQINREKENANLSRINHIDLCHAF